MLADWTNRPSPEQFDPTSNTAGKDNGTMAGGNNNTRLHRAKAKKDDEYYTQLSDIEGELKYYREHFKDKIVFLNCDDPEWSNFWKYFSSRFAWLGLKELISTHYAEGEQSYKLVMTSENEEPVKIPLEGDGDFRSDECVAILDEADIVVTNPPFSLYTDFIRLLIEHKKKFLILGNKNSVTFKDVFPRLRGGEMWVGFRPMNADMWFEVPEGHAYEKVVDGKHMKHIQACWFTNLDHEKRHDKMRMFRRYKPEWYPKYDNYDAIEVASVKEIPKDYYGVMGVPITYMDKFNPDQFRLINLDTDNPDEWIGHGPLLNGKAKYRRIFIQRVDQPQDSK